MSFTSFLSSVLGKKAGNQEEVAAEASGFFKEIRAAYEKEKLEQKEVQDLEDLQARKNYQKLKDYFDRYAPVSMAEDEKNNNISIFFSVYDKLCANTADFANKSAITAYVMLLGEIGGAIASKVLPPQVAFLAHLLGDYGGHSLYDFQDAAQNDETFVVFSKERCVEIIATFFIAEALEKIGAKELVAHYLAHMGYSYFEDYQHSNKEEGAFAEKFKSNRHKFENPKREEKKINHSVDSSIFKALTLLKNSAKEDPTLATLYETLNNYYKAAERGGNTKKQKILNDFSEKHFSEINWEEELSDETETQILENLKQLDWEIKKPWQAMVYNKIPEVPTVQLFG